MADRSEKTAIGMVTEALPNVTFRIRFENGKEILGYLGGRMRKYRIRVLVGDKVKVEMSPYGETRGRIVKRL
ncbi:MAG TPA: translation initiation factor IF-1 [bacterium]|nr:translation initiation factor IF-1 [bacterium]